MEEITRDIIIKASEGNQQSFHEIYEKSSGFVYTLALRIVNNQADAQEVTQEVFVKVYQNLKGFEFRSSFKTWLFRITTNCAINAYRRKIKEQNRRVDFESVENTLQSIGNNSNLEKEENEKALAKILGSLSPEQRACLVLREIEGLSYKEMAQTLKTNINTVRTRLKRARQALIGLHLKEVEK